MKRIPLSRGLFAIVDDEDYEWLSQWKWSAMVNQRTRLAYAMRKVGQGKGKISRTVLMHRIIMEASGALEVDHINGDGLDDRRENLRLVSRTQNLRNRRTFTKNKSGFKGVTYNSVNGKWKATINLGTFDTAQEAAHAYDEAIRQLFGPFAKPNFDK